MGVNVDKIESGIYDIIIHRENPTYLSTGRYAVTVQGGEVNFRNTLTGGGTFERLMMLAIFIRQGRLSLIKVD